MQGRVVDFYRGDAFYNEDYKHHAAHHDRKHAHQRALVIHGRTYNRNDAATRKKQRICYY